MARTGSWPVTGASRRRGNSAGTPPCLRIDHMSCPKSGPMCWPTTSSRSTPAGTRNFWPGAEGADGGRYRFRRRIKASRSPRSTAGRGLAPDRAGRSSGRSSRSGSQSITMSSRRLWRLGPHRLICGDALDAQRSKTLWTAKRPRWSSPIRPTMFRSKAM